MKLGVRLGAGHQNSGVMEPRAEMSFKHLLLSKERANLILFPVLLKATQAQAKPHHLTVNFRPTLPLP